MSDPDLANAATMPGLDVTQDAAPRTTAPGVRRMLGRYEVGAALGAGGMGIVYRATDSALGRAVALKVLRDARTPERVQRLLREAQAMAQLDHAHLVRIYDIGEEGADLFLAMELVEGESLRTWLSREPRWRDRLAAVLAAARGLAAAHAAGIVHRDFKPENVLVDRSGHVKVTDFGLARAEAATADSHAALDASGIAGTPLYMAPEQHGGGMIDARADQFALAVTAWEAVYGARPFRGDSLAALGEAVRAGAIDRPAARGIPRALEAVLRRALSPDPAARFPSVDAFIAAAERVLQRRRWPFVAAGGVLVVAAGIALLAWPSPPPDRRPDAKRLAEMKAEITRRQPQLTTCFTEDARSERPSGTVTITFDIATTGRVVRASIDRDEFARGSVGACVAREAFGWQFPPGPAVTYRLPIVFEVVTQ